MLTAFLVVVIVLAVVAVVMRATGVAGGGRRNRPNEQAEPIDAEHDRKPPPPSVDPGPETSAGDPVPGSREDRERHGTP